MKKSRFLFNLFPVNDQMTKHTREYNSAGAYMLSLIILTNTEIHI